MPLAPLRYCVVSGCPEKTSQTRCTAHQQVKRQHETRYQQGAYGRPWERTKALFRATYPERVYCEECLKEGKRVVVQEYDHVIPHRGDPVLRDDIENIQPLCKSHHSAKTAREVGLGK